MSKAEQKSDWNKRPLTPAQLRYAIFDPIAIYKIYRVMMPGPAETGAPAAATEKPEGSVAVPPAEDSKQRSDGQWQRPKKVAFVPKKMPQTEAAPIPAVPAKNGETELVKTLEKENRELRERVRVLEARLAALERLGATKEAISSQAS